MLYGIRGVTRGRAPSLLTPPIASPCGAPSIDRGAPPPSNHVLCRGLIARPLAPPGLQVRTMKRARDVRDQLIGLMERVEIEMVSNASDHDAIRKCITAGETSAQLFVFRGVGVESSLSNTGVQGSSIMPQGSARTAPTRPSRTR